jgi:hypothetical protein
MKAGQVAEIAIWLTGEETPEQIARWKTEECDKIMRRTEQQYGVLIGPVTFMVKRPGEDRVPKVPDHVHGPDVRLLVGEALVFERVTYTIRPATGFVHDLTKDDLEKLRRITRRAHRRAYPGDRLSDAQCDAIIESLGPDTAVKTLRDGAAVN